MITLTVPVADCIKLNSHCATIPPISIEQRQIQDEIGKNQSLILRRCSLSLLSQQTGHIQPALVNVGPAFTMLLQY